jgi:predicted ATPase
MMMMTMMMMMMMMQHRRYCCRCCISVQHLVAANTHCYYDFYNTGAAMVNGIRTTATTTTATTTTTTRKSSSLPRRHSSSCHHLRYTASTLLDCRNSRRRRRSFSSTTVTASTDEPKPKPQPQQPQQQQQPQQIRLLRQVWRESMQNDKKYLILYYDHGQLQAAKRLERLQIALQGYDNQPIRRHAMEMFQWKQQQQEQQQQQQNHKEQGKLENDNDGNNNSSKEKASSSSSSSLPANDGTKRGETNTRNATTTKLSKSRHEGTGPPLTMDDDNDDCANSTAGSGSPTETTTTAVASPPPPPPPQQQQLLLPRVPRGLYLYGHVGTGKSMLMDTFFDLVQVAPGLSKSSSTRRKQKMHFHAFMADIHQRMHALRNNKDNRERDGDGESDGDYDDDDWPILHRVGFQLANDVSLLCLDEFQISDVADAMILSQLLHVLFVSGVVLVTTSNRPPHDLYPDDVSGEYFSTFVQNLMQRYCILHEMESTIDYRQQCSSTMMDVSSSTTSSSSSAATPFWISSRSIQWTLNDNIDQHDEIDDGTVYRRDCIRTTVDDILAQQLVGRYHDGAGHGGGDIVYAPFDLPLGHGRSLKIPQVAHVEIIKNNNGAVSSSSSSSPLRPPVATVHVARMTFHQLCHDDSLLGACDYRALARHFDVVVVEEIPILNVSTVAASRDYNQAKRFVILIDELYEAKSTLMCSSLQAMHPSEIFIRGRDGSHEDIHCDADEPSKSNDKSNAAAVSGAAIDGVVSHGHTMVVNAGIRELQFASKRASSRLTEMTSQRWWRQRIIEKKESSSSKAQTPK